MIIKHFVEFISPGTFVSERSSYPIDSWDVDRAVEMSGDVNERYGARPFGFRFYTMENDGTELNARRTATSGIYFLGGEILTIEDVKKRYPHNDILLFNMESIPTGKIIENRNSYLSTLEFGERDVLLPQPEWAKNA